MKALLLILVLVLTLVALLNFKAPWAFSLNVPPEEVTCKLMLRLEVSSLEEVRAIWKQLCGERSFKVVALPGGALLQTRGIAVAGNSLRLQRVAEAMVAHEAQVRCATQLKASNSLHDLVAFSRSSVGGKRRQMEILKNQLADLEISELMLNKQYVWLGAVLSESLEKLEKLKQSEVSVPAVQSKLSTVIPAAPGMDYLLSVSRRGLKPGHPLVALQREEEIRLLTARNIAAADAVERHGIAVRNLDHDCYHMIEKLQQLGRQMAWVQDARKQLQAGHFAVNATDAIPPNLAAPHITCHAF